MKLEALRIDPERLSHYHPCSQLNQAKRQLKKSYIKARHTTKVMRLEEADYEVLGFNPNLASGESHCITEVSAGWLNDTSHILNTTFPFLVSCPLSLLRLLSSFSFYSLLPTPLHSSPSYFLPPIFLLRPILYSLPDYKYYQDLRTIIHTYRYAAHTLVALTIPCHQKGKKLQI